MTVSGAGWDPIEESFISFLPRKNVFCFVRSSISAPPPRAVADFLNVMQIPRGTTWKVEPLIEPARFQQAANAGSALWVEVLANPNAVPANATGIWRGIGAMRNIGADALVEIRVSTSRGRSSAQARQNIWQEAENVRSEMLNGSGIVESAKVKVPGQPQPIDLVMDHLVLQVETALNLGATDRTLNADLVFHLQDSHVAAQAGRIDECIRAL